MFYRICWTNKHQQFWIIENSHALSIQSIESIQAIKINKTYLFNGQIRISNEMKIQIPTSQVSHIFNISIDYTNHILTNPLNLSHISYHSFLIELTKHFFNVHLSYLNEMNTSMNMMNLLSQQNNQLQSQIKVSISFFGIYPK